jgi:hypothetical protein
MWWLSYQRSGRPYCVVIMDGSSLSAVRMRATLNKLGAGGTFTTGYPLDERCTAMLTPGDVGRMLSPQEAAALLDRFEGVVKKPPAPSTRRRQPPAEATG